MFWYLGALILLLAVAITLFPLLRGKSAWQPIGLALTFGVPALALYLYQDVGTPQAIDLAAAAPAAQNANLAAHEQQQEMDEMIDQLRGKLSETPADLDGWLLLSRTLKTLQRFDDAEEAAETAFRIDPENPFVIVELVEARLFVSGDGRLSDKDLGLLQHALEIDPTQQKGLWLLGMSSAQSGDDTAAIAHWETLIELLEPGSSVAQAVESQIEQAKVRMGTATLEPDNAAPEVTAEWSVPLTVSAAPDVMAILPDQYTLWVMIRPEGVSAGPPIGVKRIASPTFPVDLDLSNGDAMMQDTRISDIPSLTLQARISLSGSPAAQSGDFQSNPLNISTQAADSVELRIDQVVQ